MSKCCLCKNNHPDNKGSHVVPLSILRNLVSKESGNLRNRETSFTLSSLRNSSIYLGPQMTTPEKMTEIVGRVLTDEELSEQSNQFIRAYFLCTPCEKRFSVLEGFYSDKLLKTVNDFRTSTKNIDQITNNEDAYALFFLSVVWRMSVTSLANFKLTAQIENEIRAVLNDVLSEDKKQLLSNIAKAKEIIMSWPIIYGIADTSIDEVYNVVTCEPNNNAPYSLIINEYILLIYLNEEFTKISPQSFFGLENLVTHDNISNSKRLTLVKVTAQEYNQACEKLNDKILQQYFNDGKFIFIEMYKKKKGEAPSEQLVNKCIAFVWREGILPADFTDTKKIGERIIEFYNNNYLPAK